MQGREIIATLTDLTARICRGRVGYRAIATELRELAKALDDAAGGAKEGQAADAPSDIRKEQLAGARRIFDHWLTVTGRGSRVIYTAKRRTKIMSRLKSFTEAQLKAVMTAAAASDFHQGENDHGNRYDTVASVYTSDERVEKWLEKIDEAEVDRHAEGGDPTTSKTVALLEAKAIEALGADDVAEYERLNEEAARLRKGDE